MSLWQKRTQTLRGSFGHINIIGAGDGDDPEFFRLYIGQALNLRARLEQHSDPIPRKCYQ